jgi:hypothetical protein
MKKMLLALLVVPALAWGQTFRPLGIRTTTGALDGYTPGYVSNWTNVLGDAPHNTSVYARSNGTWVVLSPSSTNASAWVTANSNAVQYMIGQTGYWNSAWAWVNSNSGGVSYVFGQTGTWDSVSSWVALYSNAVQYMVGRTNVWDSIAANAATNVGFGSTDVWAQSNGVWVVIAIPTTNGFTTFPDVTNIVNVMTQGLAQASSIPSTNGFTTFPDVTNVVNVMTQGLAQASSVPSTNGLWNRTEGTNWVDSTYYPRNNPSNWVGASITNGLVTAAITNGLATPSVTNGLVTSAITNGLAYPSVTNGLVTSAVTNGLEQASHASATFVPYTGATAAVNLGGQSATNAGTIHGTNIVAMGTLNVSGAATLSGKTNSSAMLLGIGTNLPLNALHVVSTPNAHASYLNFNIVNETYSDSQLGYILQRRAKGTYAAPSALQNGDQVGGLAFRGYGATGFSSGSRSSMFANCFENWTDTDQGMGFVINVTPTNTASAVSALSIQADRSLRMYNMDHPPLINTGSGYIAASNSSVYVWDGGSGTRTQISSHSPADNEHIATSEDNFRGISTMIHLEKMAKAVEKLCEIHSNAYPVLGKWATKIIEVTPIATNDWRLWQYQQLSNSVAARAAWNALPPDQREGDRPKLYHVPNKMPVYMRDAQAQYDYLYPNWTNQP